jgi:CRP/FNR family transcriptional regulator
MSLAPNHNGHSGHNGHPVNHDQHQVGDNGTNGAAHCTDSASTAPLADLFADEAVAATRTEFAPGALIYEQDSPADKVYFIHSGQARIYQIAADGSSRLAEILGPGQWFGCAALSGGGRYAARVVAAVATVVSVAQASQLLEHVVHNPAAAAGFIKTLANRVQSARTDSARLVFDDCNQRLIQAMLRFSTSAAATLQGDAVVLHLTHEQLAQAVGAARETVSLALTEMRLQNVVRTGRNRLIFKPEALKQFVGRPRRGAVAEAGHVG